MRCVACGGEMILVNVDRLQNAAVSSCIEDHSFICLGCHEVERRLILTRHGREIDMAPSIVPVSAAQDDHIAALLRRVFAKIRGQ
jgi:hypothetical protein